MGGSGGSRSFASQNFSSLSGGTAAANAKGEEHEACAASNSAAGESRLHLVKQACRPHKKITGASPIFSQNNFFKNKT